MQQFNDIMFLELDKKERSKVAAIDDSLEQLTYGDICDFSATFAAHVPSRSLLFILATNTIGSLLGYTSSLITQSVPLIVSAKTDDSLLNHFLELYKPQYLWMPKGLSDKYAYRLTGLERSGYVLVETGYDKVFMYGELSLLLPTSGSTGSPKLVRHSYRNIEANARNVAALFQLNGTERAMASLPMHYTMGLSVIASHLYAGSTLLLCDKSLMDVAFWDMLEGQHATSFTGVPYSFELLNKLRFFRMPLPDLQVVTQGGGKLTEELWEKLATYAETMGKQFIATYGQSECTARMAYLPAQWAKTKVCSIGIAEPGGRLSLLNDHGLETENGVDTGELIYRGENVTLGYANSREDLTKGDENNGVMHTGDLARRDEDGCYFIIGRLKRFLKIFGLRIGLDEVENLIRSNYDTDCYCSGTDEKLVIKLTNPNVVENIPSFIEEKIHLFHQTVEVVLVDAIMRNEAGKVINQ